MIYFLYLIFLIIKTIKDLIHQSQTINRLHHIRNRRNFHFVNRFINRVNIIQRANRYPLDISLFSLLNNYNVNL